MQFSINGRQFEFVGLTFQAKNHLREFIARGSLAYPDVDFEKMTALDFFEGYLFNDELKVIYGSCIRFVSAQQGKESPSFFSTADYEGLPNEIGEEIKKKLLSNLTFADLVKSVCRPRKEYIKTLSQKKEKAAP